MNAAMAEWKKTNPATATAFASYGGFAPAASPGGYRSHSSILSASNAGTIDAPDCGLDSQQLPAVIDRISSTFSYQTRKPIDTLGKNEACVLVIRPIHD